MKKFFKPYLVVLLKFLDEVAQSLHAFHGHGVVEVGGVGHTGLVGGVNVVVGGTRMGDGGQNAVVAARLDEIYRAGQFGRFVPTLEAGTFFQNLVVFVGLGRLTPVGNVRTGLCGIELGAFEVQTHHGAVGLVHEFLAGLDGGLYHFDSRRRESGIDGCGAVLEMGVYGHAEGFFGAFHEVAATTAVYVHLNATWHNIGTAGVYDFGVYNVEIGGKNGLDFVAVHYERTALEPTLWREYAAIYNLFHSRLWFKGLFE